MEKKALDFVFHDKKNATNTFFIAPNYITVYRYLLINMLA